MMGACCVGKTSIVLRYLNSTAPHMATLGVTYVEFGLENGRLIHPKAERHMTRVGLWDTAGQERYAPLLPMYYRNADVAIVVHDGSLDSIATAETLVRKVRASEPTIKVMLVQNKSDLRLLNQKFIERLAPDKSAYVCTLRGDSVHRMLHEAVALARSNPSTLPQETVTVAVQEKTKCCRVL